MSDVVFDQIRATVQQFADHYRIPERNYAVTQASGVQTDAPLRIEVQFDPANSMFKVVCFGDMSCVTQDQQRANTQTLLQSLRREVLGPLALRSLPAADKNRFLQSIVDSAIGLPAYLRQWLEISPNLADLENAQIFACKSAENITETDHPGHLDDPNSPWHQVVVQRNLSDPQNDVVAIMQCLANNVRRQGLASQKTFFQMGTVPEEFANAENRRPWIAPQIGDGYYEGAALQEVTSSAGTPFVCQTNELSGELLLHRMDAFSGDSPLNRKPPCPSRCSIAIAYANGKASWDYPLRAQQQLQRELQRHAPPGVAIEFSSPWKVQTPYKGRIVRSPVPEFVLQQDKSNPNILYAHWAHAFDFPPKPTLDTRFQEFAEIESKGNGRMFARPYCREAERTTYYPGADVGRWLLRPDGQEAPGAPTSMAGQIARSIPHSYFRDAIGTDSAEYAQQLSTLEQKIPASARGLLQVAQPDSTYAGPLLAQTPLFVLQAAYPQGQTTAVPVLHWRKDFAQTKEAPFPPDSKIPGARAHINYADTGIVKLSDCTACLHPQTEAQQVAFMQAVLGRDGLEHINRTQLGIAHDAILSKPLLSSSNHEGYVIAQDANHIYLHNQAPSPHGQLLVYPKAIFSEGAPRVAPGTLVTIECRNARAVFELMDYQLQPVNHPPAAVNPTRASTNLMSMRANTTHCMTM